MKQFESSDQPENDGALDVEALYNQCIEIEARDHLVGRVLCALVRNMASTQGLDVPEHEAQAVAAMGTQIVTPDEETQPDTMPVQDADVSKTEDKPAPYKYDAKNAAKGKNDYGN